MCWVVIFNAGIEIGDEPFPGRAKRGVQMLGIDVSALQVVCQKVDLV